MPYADRARQRAAVQQRQNRIRRALYDYKESKPCMDCGQKYPFWIMQFDHLGDKKFLIGQHSASFGSEILAREILKCDLVCANCHATRTYRRKQATLSELVKVTV